MDDLDRDEFLCWSCQKQFAQGEGVSVDDTGEEHVCEDCWDHVPVTQRLVLGLLFRTSHQGGIGLKDLLKNAIERYPWNWGDTRPPSAN